MARLTHILQTHTEKPLLTCPACGKLVRRNLWVLEDSGKRTVLCDHCVSEVRRDTDKLFMQRIKEMAYETRLGRTETAQDRTV